MSQCHPAPQWQLSKGTPTNPKRDESVWAPMNLPLGPSGALDTLHTKLSCTAKSTLFLIYPQVSINLPLQNSRTQNFIKWADTPSFDVNLLQLV